jgi:hypothetical protein
MIVEQYTLNCSCHSLPDNKIPPHKANIRLPPILISKTHSRVPVTLGFIKNCRLNKRGGSMINHVWGLVHHPDKEWRDISNEHETVSHLYKNHVLWLAAIPVVSTFIGTTQFGWTFGGEDTIKVSMESGLGLGILFYALILTAVTIVGSLIHWLARKYPNCPSRNECIVFAGYMSTPMFLSGLFAIYPMIWLCTLACIMGICYTGYLLYSGTPSFLGISNQQGFIISSTTLAIGVLVLEVLLAAVVLLWSLGADNTIIWNLFR